MCVCLSCCVCVSLDIAVVIGAIGFSHVHASHGHAHTGDAVAAGWHTLVDAVQPLGLFEAGYPMLGGEASDCCRENPDELVNHICYEVHTATHTYTQTHTHTHTHTHTLVRQCFNH